MDLSKIKMVVTDMDGTLLNSNHEVSSRFFELFQELKKRDILFVAASGRQYHSIIDKLRPIKDDIIVIAENGSYTMNKQEELLSTPLDKTFTHMLLRIVQSIEGSHTVLCTKDNAYVNYASHNFVDKLKEYYTEYAVLENLMEHKGEVLKIAVYHPENTEKYVYPAVKHLEDQLKVKVSGENWLDISHQNAHKGYALQKLLDLFQIGPKEVMVFGDYNNDLEMLALSDFSFAMENAHPNVLEVAKYSTASNDDFGVEQVLEKLLG
ncbi:Cof-type HAD-IIB family hydrolase [Flavobacteriaceae bacterium F89]|uniref:Cof-type HAD-IIB family hydrolase n=1 Tax=Cerina litoralis TaxID=2874477 RepID=A0AAE3JN26_9FLAO|nr:HAD family hydrolase [Cerina litoralis]MCG2459436.1 Cof-type HAD-IIB family hydrolase [Cerina litoralis]